MKKRTTMGRLLAAAALCAMLAGCGTRTEANVPADPDPAPQAEPEIQTPEHPQSPPSQGEEPALSQDPDGEGIASQTDESVFYKCRVNVASRNN